ncbi:hypothetical protein C5G17_11090 [Salmonella enterica]|nr:hypothetical protein [Salmonella enterica]
MNQKVLFFLSIIAYPGITQAVNQNVMIEPLVIRDSTNYLVLPQAQQAEFSQCKSWPHDSTVIPAKYEATLLNGSLISMFIGGITVNLYTTADVKVNTDAQCTLLNGNFPGYYGITCFVTGYDTDKAVPVRTDNGMSIIESKLYATGTMRYITEIPMDGSGFQGMAIGGAVVINTGAITPTPNTGVISNITMPPLYDPGFIFTVPGCGQYKYHSGTGSVFTNNNSTYTVASPIGFITASLDKNSVLNYNELHYNDKAENIELGKIYLMYKEKNVTWGEGFDYTLENSTINVVCADSRIKTNVDYQCRNGDMGACNNGELGRIIGNWERINVDTNCSVTVILPWQ